MKNKIKGNKLNNREAIENVSKGTWLENEIEKNSNNIEKVENSSTLKSKKRKNMTNI